MILSLAPYGFDGATRRSIHIREKSSLARNFDVYSLFAFGAGTKPTVFDNDRPHTSSYSSLTAVQEGIKSLFKSIGLIHLDKRSAVSHFS